MKKSIIIIIILVISFCLLLSSSIGGGIFYNFQFSTPITTQSPITTQFTTPQITIRTGGKTVKQKLSEKCPKNSTDKITPTSNILYDDYLFSACTDAVTCDLTSVDNISHAILNMTETCGTTMMKTGGYKFNTDTKKWKKITTKDKLIEKCPKDPNANNMINVGNSATYDNYLFSACTDANTCDKEIPDPISEALIKTSQGCGAWNLSREGYTWNYNTNKWVKNVKQRLIEKCPKDPNANGMINNGNSASYDDYLFSGCLNAETCDGLNPDPVSQAILNMNNHCGAWNINNGQYNWDNNQRRWV